VLEVLGKVEKRRDFLEIEKNRLESEIKIIKSQKR